MGKFWGLFEVDEKFESLSKEYFNGFSLLFYSTLLFLRLNIYLFSVTIVLLFKFVNIFFSIFRVCLLLGSINSFA